MVVGYGFFDGQGLSEPFRIAAEHGRIKFFETSLNPYRNDTIWAIFFGSLVSWCGCYCISQTEVQRFCSTKSPSHARRTLFWNIPPVLLIALLAIWCGVVMFARYFNCDPVSMGIIKRTDQLMPYFVMETMSHLPGVSPECTSSRVHESTSPPLCQSVSVAMTIHLTIQLVTLNCQSTCTLSTFHVHNLLYLLGPCARSRQ